METHHSCELHNYLTTSTLTPQTVCVSSVRISDAVQRLRILKEHIDIASGKYIHSKYFHILFLI